MSLGYALKNTLINCWINFTSLFRAPPLPTCMYILSILLSYQLVVLILKIMLQLRSNTLTTSFPKTCRIKHLNDNCWWSVCFVRTNPAICFSDKSCNDQLARPSTGLSSVIPSAFQRVQFELIHNSLSMLPFTLLPLATVGLCHSGHVYPFWLIY